MDLRKMFPWLPEARLTVEMYEEAMKKGLSFGEWLEAQKAASEGNTPYTGLTQFEMIMAKSAAKRAGAMEIPTAFDDLLGHFKLNLNGAHSDAVGKFFSVSDTSVLLGEYISQVVAASIIRTSLASQLVALHEYTDAIDFRRTYLEDDGDDLELAQQGKSDELQDLWIRVGDQSMKLHRYGRYIKANFDDVDRVSFNAFNIALSRIGMQVGVSETCDVIYIAVKGDGSDDSAATVFYPAASGTLTIPDVVKVATQLESPYKGNYVIGRKAQMQSYLGTILSAGLQNPVESFNSASASLPVPIDWNKSEARTGLAADNLLVLDSRYCVAGVSSMAVFTESERIVKKQIKGTGVWYRSAHYKMDNNGCALMDVTFG